MQEYIFGDFTLVNITFGLWNSPTDTFPFTYQPFDGPGMRAVDNFQFLIFGNSQSPNKFTGKQKRTTITTKTSMGKILRLQELGEDKMNVEGSEERGIESIVIRPSYGLRPLGVRPMPFTTLLICAFLIPRPTKSRRIQKWRPIMSTAIIIQWGKG